MAEWRACIWHAEMGCLTCRCMHAHAGHKTKPHLICRKTMEPPQRAYSNSAKGNRVSAIVFINLKHGVFVKLLTGTRVPHATGDLKKLLPTGNYSTIKGDPASRMTTKEYIECVRSAMIHFAGKGATVYQRERVVKQLRLVHDKSTCHPGAPIDVGLPGAKLNVSMAAPRSPDLMPLDYAVFGLAKRKLLDAQQSHWTWADRAAFFIRTLQDFNPKACIEAYPARLQECWEKSGARVSGRRNCRTSSHT